MAHYHDESDEIQPNQEHYWQVRGIHDAEFDLRLQLSYEAQTAVKDYTRRFIYTHGIAALYVEDFELKQEHVDALVDIIKGIDTGVDMGEIEPFQIQDLVEVFLVFKY